MYKYYTILYKGLEHPHALASVGVREPVLRGDWGITISKFLGIQKEYLVEWRQS